MIEKLTDVPPEIDGVRAGGLLTHEEYDTVVLPLLQEAERTDRKLRILCGIDDDYAGVTPARSGRTCGWTPAPSGASPRSRW